MVWKPEFCQHSTRCWTQLPAVFNPREKHWIDPNGASPERIEKQVKACPSGALEFIRNTPATLLVLAFLIWGLLSGCGHSGRSGDAPGKDSSVVVNTKGDPTTQMTADTASEPGDRRSILIRELKKLGAVFATNDKEKIAKLFHFPIPDSLLSVFVNDSNFDKEKEKNEGVTKEMYDRYYPSLAKGWSLNMMDTLFRKIHVDELRKKDKLEYKYAVRSKPCLDQYFLEVQDDSTISIFYGSNGNPNYQLPKKKIGNDSDDDDISVCEWDVIWDFHFDGRRLSLTRQSFAG